MRAPRASTVCRAVPQVTERVCEAEEELGAVKSSSEANAQGVATLEGKLVRAEKDSWEVTEKCKEASKDAREAMRAVYEISKKVGADRTDEAMSRLAELEQNLKSGLQQALGDEDLEKAMQRQAEELAKVLASKASADDIRRATSMISGLENRVGPIAQSVQDAVQAMAEVRSNLTGNLDELKGDLEQKADRALMDELQDRIRAEVAKIEAAQVRMT